MNLGKKNFTDCRILEIGDFQYFGRIYPEQTDWIWSGHQKPEKQNISGVTLFSPQLAWRLFQELRAGKYDLIVIPQFKARLWRPSRGVIRNTFFILKQVVRNFQFWGAYWVLLVKPKETPAIIMDMLDTMVIGSQNFWTFPHIAAYFKRELPQNNWHAFLYTSDKNEDVSNIRRQKRFRAAMAKIRPFPLGLLRKALDVDWFPEKEFDVFYAGDNPKTTVRMRGVESLKRLRDKGYRVDIAESRIDPEEFQRRCSRAWLVWSPEGSGWDCGRHYESIGFGSVPVINYPTIDRYKPLIDGEHCFFYGCEGDDLHRVMEAALRDKETLRRMVRQGREHLNAHYPSEKIVEYILTEINRSEADPTRCF